MLLSCCKRCLDRGCRLDSHHTKKLAQEDYEFINTGPDPNMDYRYANMLVVVYVVMMYGSGIPILYLVAAVFFFATYWVDKILILYHYRKPEMLDEKMSVRTLGWFKYAILLHLVGGILMYSNNSILPVYSGASKTSYDDEISTYTTFFTFGSLNSVHMSVYIGFFACLIALYIVWRVFIQTIVRFVYKFCKQKISFFEDEIVVPDFYDALKFVDLRKILEENQAELKDLEKMVQLGTNLKPQLTDEDLQKYFVIVEDRIKAVKAAILKNAQRQFAEHKNQLEGKEFDEIF